MACRLFGAKPLSEPIMNNCELDPEEQISVKFESKHNNLQWKKINLMNVICKMAAILSRPSCDNPRNVSFSGMYHVHAGIYKPISFE